MHNCVQMFKKRAAAIHTNLDAFIPARCTVLEQILDYAGVRRLQLMLCCFSNDVNFEELARCTDDFNGAMCKAVCVEAVSVLTSHNFLVRT